LSELVFANLNWAFYRFLPTHFAKRWTTQDKMCAIEAQQRKFTTNFSVITSKGARSKLILDAYLSELQKT